MKMHDCDFSMTSTASSVLHRPQASKRSSRDERTVLGKSQSTDTSSGAEIDIWQKPKADPQPQKSSEESTAKEVTPVTSKKVPKFSRLFKLSRSPLKVIQESNRRSKSADSRSTAASTKNGQSQLQQSPQKVIYQRNDIWIVAPFFKNLVPLPNFPQINDKNSKKLLDFSQTRTHQILNNLMNWKKAF